MKRLSRSEFEPLAPDDPGTVRINHDTAHCSGTSKSLRITRKDDGSISARCYRCGAVGYVAPGKFYRAKKALRVTAPTINKDKVELPNDFTTEISGMPPVVRAKLFSCGIQQREMSKYGIGWSELYDRLIYPVYENGKLVAWQGKYYGDKDDQPRFITRHNNHPDLFSYYPNNAHTQSCIVVEDILSGIRVHEHASTLVLFGTEISDAALLHVSSLHREFKIFLDDDNATVKNKARQIAERLTMLGKDVKILHSNGLDPKELDSKSLKKFIGI